MKLTKGALPRQQDHPQEGSQPVAATGHRSLLIPLDKFSSFAFSPHVLVIADNIRPYLQPSQVTRQVKLLLVGTFGRVWKRYQETCH